MSDKKIDKQKVFTAISSDEVVDIPGVKPARFVRPSESMLSGQPVSLAQDANGYLVPDPELMFWLHLEGEQYARQPLALTRQTKQILSGVIAHREATNLDGIHKEERYLVIEGKGGIGKSYTIQSLFGRAKVPIICEKVPGKEEKADELLFGNPLAINPNPTNVIDTARAFYRGRGLKRPETQQFLKDHKRELFLSLHPGPEGWFTTNPKAYSGFWQRVADLEGIEPGQRTIPKMGLFEVCYRNGVSLFLDELNRLKEGVRDNCMRAFEGTKSLETNLGTLLAADKHPGTMIIGAMNGARRTFNTKALDSAQRRRAKIQTVPAFSEGDYRDYVEFLITGVSPGSRGISLKGDSPDRSAVGAVCKPEFIRLMTETPQGKIAQKDLALKDLVAMHCYMEKQIETVLEGSGLAEKEEIDLQELIPTGPPLFKAFIDRAYQLITVESPDGKMEGSIGVYAAVEQLSQAFKEVYVEPLIARGIPEAKISQIVNFGTYGDQKAQGKQMPPLALGHIASMFSPMRPQDFEGVTKKSKGLMQAYMEDGGIYAANTPEGVILAKYVVTEEKDIRKPSVVPLDTPEGKSIGNPLIARKVSSFSLGRLSEVEVDFDSGLTVEF